LNSSTVCWFTAALVEYRRMVAYMAFSGSNVRQPGELRRAALPSFLRQLTSRLVADDVEKLKTGGAGPRSAGFAICSTPRLGDQRTARGFLASEGEPSG
jgi:hypothetical protein